MLTQITFWAERAGMVLDVALMLRILALRLHRTYLFLSLYAFLSLFYDGVGLLLGTESEDFSRVLIISKFLYALVLPLVLWDLFEEAKPIVEKLRRLAMSRMISSLLFISLWGLLVAAFTGGDDNGQSHYLLRLALVVWTGSIAAALAFLWVMRKGIRANSWHLPHNTNIWFRYFQWLFAVEAASCAFYLFLPLTKNIGSEVARASEPVFQLFEMILTGWCIFKLRATPSSDVDASAKVNV